MLYVHATGTQIIIKKLEMVAFDFIIQLKLSFVYKLLVFNFCFNLCGKQNNLEQYKHRNLHE